MASGSEIIYDPEYGSIINEANVSEEDAALAVRMAFDNEQFAATVAQLSRWGESTQSTGRNGSIFQRDRYVTPKSLFDQFRTAIDAAESDDVVSGVVESTEALAFSEMNVECLDEDEKDVWNQIFEDIDFDQRIREMWRELFTVSQFYGAIMWGKKSYKVRGVSDTGTKRKKTFTNLTVPLGISILDPLKVIPVGNFLFGQEQLAYIATPGEAPIFDDVLAGHNTTDLVVRSLITGKYVPDKTEKQYIKDVTNIRNAEHLYLMNPENVFRHTLTRPAYQRFATCRMKSVFELLDLKQQLRQMDRAYLIGGTNFIILVKKGSDAVPATNAELGGLAGQVRAAARVPVIVGDHRISVEIVTPKLDVTLKPERYNAIDARISARLYQIFMTGNFAAGAKGDDSIKLAKVVARGMESRRDLLRKSLHKKLLYPTFAKNTQLEEFPKLVFHPNSISLDFDPALLTYLQDLRDRGDISRETLLRQIDIDQVDEARKREREEEKFDKIFQPTNVPFSTPVGGGPAKPAAAPTGNTKGVGRRGGGNTGGGGTNKQSTRTGPPRGPSKDS